MEALSGVAGFAVVAGLLTIIPGLDTALVLRTAVTRGHREGFATAVGINTGVLVWGMAAAVGVSALLVASDAAYTALRLLGAAYMVWLGLVLLRNSWRRGSPATPGREPESAGPPDARGGVLRAWVRGTLTNLSNPKVGAFYIAALPQFIPERASHLAMGALLALVHDVEGIAWFALLIFGAHLVREQLARDSVHRTLDRITGVVLVGFGVRLALAGR